MRLVLILLIILFTNYGLAQSSEDDVITESTTLQYLLDTNVVIGLSNEFETLQENSNKVYIEQQGLENIANVNTKVASSDLKIRQNGIQNTATIDITAKELQATLNQNGNKNIFTEMVNDPNIEIRRQVEQTGNNHSLVIYGSNSLMKDLKIKMIGTAKNITVRNFN